MAAEMGEWLRVLAVLPEDLNAIPNIHLLAHNCLDFKFQGTQCPFLASVGTCGIQTCMQAKLPDMQNRIIINLKTQVI